MAKDAVDRSHNVKDKTILKAVRTLTGTLEDLASAQAHHKNACKNAETDGVDVKILLKALQTKKRERDDVVADQRKFLRYEALISGQGEMFVERAGDDEQREDDEPSEEGEAQDTDGREFSGEDVTISGLPDRDPNAEPEVQTDAEGFPVPNDEHKQWECRQAGRQRGEAGDLRESNPYEAGSAENWAWDGGWIVGARTLEASAEGVKKATPRRSRSKPADEVSQTTH